MHNTMEDMYNTAVSLRKKVNSAVKAFSLDVKRAPYPIDISEREAWLIDAYLPFDGYGNNSTATLLQIYETLNDDDEALVEEEEMSILREVRELLGEDDDEEEEE